MAAETDVAANDDDVASVDVDSMKKSTEDSMKKSTDSAEFALLEHSHKTLSQVSPPEPQQV